MANVGYSGTPLIKKLGIKPGMKILLINQPADYFAWLGEDLTDRMIAKNGLPNLIHLFAQDSKAFETGMQTVLKHCKKNPTVITWVSWYKKTAGIKTDLTENLIRDFALHHQLVDVKVCAVNEHWSGLKLVVPVAKRQSI